MVDAATLKKYGDKIAQHWDFNIKYDWWDSTYEHISSVAEHMGFEVYKNGPKNTRDLIYFSLGRGYYCEIYGYFNITSVNERKLAEHTGDEELKAAAAKLVAVRDVWCMDVAGKVTTLDTYVRTFDAYIAYTSSYDEVPDDIFELVEGIVHDAVKLLASKALSWLEDEYEYLVSDEGIYEALEANDMLDDDDEGGGDDE